MSTPPAPEPARRPPAPAASPRGILLVVAAIALGAFHLRSAFDTPDDVAADPGAEAPATTVEGGEAPDGTDGGAPGDTTVPEATVPARAPNEVRVLVLNGTTTQGVARRFTDRMAAANYVTVNPGNIPGAQGSSVWFVPGYESDANQVAATLGLGPDRVDPLPEPSPVPDATLQGAHVVLVVGPDLATQQ